MPTERVHLFAWTPIEIGDFHRYACRFQDGIDAGIHAKMVDLHLVRFNVCGTVLLDGAVVDQEGLVEARVRFQPCAGDELVMGGQRNAKLFSVPLIWLTLK